jgi:uncharacterized protein YqgC (DUF456 family)
MRDLIMLPVHLLAVVAMFAPFIAGCALFTLGLFWGLADQQMFALMLPGMGLVAISTKVMDGVDRLYGEDKR